MNEPTPKQKRILDFIREFSESQGMPPTRADIATHFGIERASVQEHLQLLAKKGLLEIVAGASRGLRLPEVAQPPPPPNPYEMPLLGRIAAGAPVISDVNIQERIKCDPDLFRPRADFLFKVEGHSMEDAHILDGDLVGIREQSVAEDRQIVAVAIEDGSTDDMRLTLKRFRKSGPVVTLLSENADQDRYAPIVVDARERKVAIVGLFAGLIRRPK
jgi:repressor LexA